MLSTRLTKSPLQGYAEDLRLSIMRKTCVALSYPRASMYGPNPEILPNLSYLPRRWLVLFTNVSLIVWGALSPNKRPSTQRRESRRRPKLPIKKRRASRPCLALKRSSAWFYMDSGLLHPAGAVQMVLRRVSLLPNLRNCEERANHRNRNAKSIGSARQTTPLPKQATSPIDAANLIFAIRTDIFAAVLLVPLFHGLIPQVLGLIRQIPMRNLLIPSVVLLAVLHPFRLQTARGEKKGRRGRKEKMDLSSDSVSEQSRHSFKKLLRKGICHSRRKLARSTSRHAGLEAHRKPRDKSDAIVDRLGAMAEGGDRKAGNPSKIAQLTVCALR